MVVSRKSADGLHKKAMTGMPKKTGKLQSERQEDEVSQKI